MQMNNTLVPMQFGHGGKPNDDHAPDSSKSGTLIMKAEELLDARHIRENMQQLQISRKDSLCLMETIRALQRSVYSLDCYGESTWNVDFGQITGLWDSIYRGFIPLKISPDQVKLLVTDMKRYEEIELSLREGKLPTRFPIENFYRLKACDVKMSRKILSFAATSELSPILSRLWDCFDLVSEVHDDLEDVREDLLSYNCNRFIIEGQAIGKIRTNEDYRQFLQAIIERTTELLEKAKNSDIAHAHEIGRWVMSKADLSKALLDYYMNVNVDVNKLKSIILTAGGNHNPGLMKRRAA
jgi:hypothetical protein